MIKLKRTLLGLSPACVLLEEQLFLLSYSVNQGAIKFDNGFYFVDFIQEKGQL